MRVSAWVVWQFIRIWPLRGAKRRRPRETRDNEALWSPLERDARPSRFLRIPTDEELMRRAYLRRLARDVRDLGINRRHFYDWVADEIYGFQGLYMTFDGKMIDPEDLPETEAAFIEEERWVDGFYELADREPKQAVQKKVIPRLRLIAMAYDAYRSRQSK